MAQTIAIISGSPLIGSPIVYRVTPASYDADRTFHRIMVRVYAALETDADYTTFDFSTPVEVKPSGASYATQPSDFDISSALQAVADKYAPSAVFPTRNPYIKFRVEAWDEWMVDGIVSTNQGKVAWPSLPVGTQQFYGYAFMGAWTDLQRMGASVDQSGMEYLTTDVMSRKPTTTPEIVFVNCPFVYPDTFSRSILDVDHMSTDATPVFVSGAPTTGPRSLSHTPQSDGGATVGGRSLYAIPRPAGNGYILRFINGMGCMESLHVQSLVKRDVGITTEKHTVAKQETLKQFSRSIVRKSNDRETWTLTSGPLDEQWASWYIHEFLMAEHVWIMVNDELSIVNGIWVPCHVVPDDTTLLEDRQKAQPFEVQFKLEMDINGNIAPS